MVTAQKKWDNRVQQTTKVIKKKRKKKVITWRTRSFPGNNKNDTKGMSFGAWMGNEKRKETGSDSEERSEKGKSRSKKKKKKKMGIRFVLMVNKQGQTRLAQYYEHLTLEERRALEGEIVRKCLARTDQQVSLPHRFIPFSFWKFPLTNDQTKQCSFVEHRNYKIVYRRYASLFFLVGVDNDEVTNI